MSLTPTELKTNLDKFCYSSVSVDGNLLNQFLTDLINASAPPYKVYNALLTQSIGNTLTSGFLTIGKQYSIQTYQAGDDFINVANVISGTIKTDGCVFIATGTTPTDYSNGSTLIDTPQPTAIVLENTLGDITFQYAGAGTYYAISDALFTPNKTFILFGATNSTYDLGYIVSDSDTNTDSLYEIRTINNVSVYSDNLLSNTAIQIRIYP